MVWPMDESQGSSPLQGHGSWLMCEVALSSPSVLASSSMHVHVVLTHKQLNTQHVEHVAVIQLLSLIAHQPVYSVVCVLVRIRDQTPYKHIFRRGQTKYSNFITHSTLNSHITFSCY
jgi:hypothetical protein